MLVVPTVPVLPRIAEVEADSRAWSPRLGHYTNFVNLLGLAAWRVPSGVHMQKVCQEELP